MITYKSSCICKVLKEIRWKGCVPITRKTDNLTFVDKKRKKLKYEIFIESISYLVTSFRIFQMKLCCDVKSPIRNHANITCDILLQCLCFVNLERMPTAQLHGIFLFPGGVEPFLSEEKPVLPEKIV